MLESYTLQEGITFYAKITSAGEIFFKAHYMNSMQDNTKWFQEKSPQQKNIFVQKHTIAHPCLDVMTVTEIKNTKK